MAELAASCLMESAVVPVALVWSLVMLTRLRLSVSAESDSSRMIEPVVKVSASAISTICPVVAASKITRDDVLNYLETANMLEISELIKVFCSFITGLKTRPFS